MPVIRLTTAILVACALGSALPAAAKELPSPRPFSLIDTSGGLSLHKEMYALPFTYANAYHGKQTEVIFQLSAKHDILGTRFYLAYTQKSFWQAYDANSSAPFRDTNFNPEVFYRFKEFPWGKGSLGGDAGFEHESNGQRVPLSRSWNLLYLAPFYHGDRWLAYVKLRYRIPEDAKETPDSALGDDNPDITDYLGYSDVQLYYRLPHGHLAHVEVRGWVGTDKGNVSLDYSVPMTGENDTWFVLRLFTGWGESLLDYKLRINRVGVGFMFHR